jgi:hypothetical protein
MNRLYLPRDEIAFRKNYASLVENASLKTVFRPGNRLYPNWRGYKEGEIVYARIIEQTGNDDDLVPPIFNNYNRKVRIKNISIKSISDLDTKDFEGSSDDIKSVEDLKKHLYQIYKKEPDEYKNLVTRIELEYI